MCRRPVISPRFLTSLVLGVAGFLLVPARGSCQGLYNESVLYINGVDVYVDGDINNSGVLENTGTLSFSGDWECAGEYEGEGSLHVIGSMSQKISHHNQEVHRVVIAGWGPKYIKGTLNIVDALHMEQGIVHVSPDDHLRLNKDVTISGGHEESFVDGALTVNGTGYKFFPVGKNGTYAPIEFLNVRGEPGMYSVEVFEDAPSVTVDNVIVRTALYWHRKDLYGDFGGSSVSLGFNRSDYQDPSKVVVVTGTTWADPFTMISDIQLSAEDYKFSTAQTISAPLILLGEMSERWHDADFYFSTALSPNAAYAENRSVKIFGQRLTGKDFQFQVFNRWGDLVFESTSHEEMTSNGWDGRTLGGRELAAGAYPFRITGFDKTGAKLEKKGVITIIH